MPPHAASLLPSPSLAADGRELLQQARERVLRMLDACAPLRDILLHLATTAESLSDGRTVASILVLDKDGLLRNGASPNLPADYLDAIDRLKPDPNVGTCAAAAATGQVVVTRTFLDDNRWAQLRHLPLALGFVGAWSMPIKTDDGRVLGTFGTYFREPREPTDEEREVVHFLALMAAFAIGARAALTAYAG
jgi:GAF domain-containing protein